MIKQGVDAVANAVGLSMPNQARRSQRIQHTLREHPPKQQDPVSEQSPQQHQTTPPAQYSVLPNASTGSQAPSAEAAQRSGDVAAVKPSAPLDAAKQAMDRDKGRCFTSATGARGADFR